MQLNSNNLLLASLLGGRSIAQINDFQQVQKVLIENDLPTVSAIQVDKNQNLWQADDPVSEAKQFFPFTFSHPQKGKFLLPFEPLISIDTKNVIKESNTAKINRSINGKPTNFQGTVKERWSRDDYEIKLTGVLIDKDMKRFPREYFTKLSEILRERIRWDVHCELLQLLDINHVVVYDFSFPFTKGENIQAYQIGLKSDFDFSLELTDADVDI